MDATLTVDVDDPTPAFEQLRRQLAHLIETGTIGDGERLPPLRQLAGDLGLAVGTVARTYRELEAAGLVRSRRGAGTRAITPHRSAALRKRLLEEAAQAYARQAAALGADRAATRQALRRALESVAAG